MAYQTCQRLFDLPEELSHFFVKFLKRFGHFSPSTDRARITWLKTNIKVIKCRIMGYGTRTCRVSYIKKRCFKLAFLFLNFFANLINKKQMAHLDKVFTVWDYAVFIVLLALSSLIGVFFAWRSRNATNSDEFFTGGRKLSLFPVTMSLVASFLSTTTLLGVPAEVYQIGTQYSLYCISMVVAIVLAAEVFMPVFYRLNITSVNEVRNSFFFVFSYKSTYLNP